MKSTRSGYPLGALFVLIAASAVLIAGVTPLVRLAAKGETAGWESVLGGVLAGVVCGCLTGIVLGLLEFRKLLGMGLGAAAGTVIGAAAGGIAMLPANQLIAAAVPMTAGSALVVGVALLMRRVDEGTNP